MSLRTPLKIWKSSQTTPVLSRSEAPVGQPQAGAAAHACTEIAARNAPCRAFRPLRHSALPCRCFKARLPASARARRAAKPQGETGGRGGNYDIFRRLSNTASRLLQTRCTGTGLAQRPPRLTAEVNSACLRSSARAPQVTRVPPSVVNKLKEPGGRGGNYFPRMPFGGAGDSPPGSGAEPRCLSCLYCVLFDGRDGVA